MRGRPCPTDLPWGPLPGLRRGLWGQTHGPHRQGSSLVHICLTCRTCLHGVLGKRTVTLSAPGGPAWGPVLGTCGGALQQLELGLQCEQAVLQVSDTGLGLALCRLGVLGGGVPVLLRSFGGAVHQPALAQGFPLESLHAELLLFQLAARGAYLLLQPPLLLRRAPGLGGASLQGVPSPLRGGSQAPASPRGTGGGAAKALTQQGPGGGAGPAAPGMLRRPSCAQQGSLERGRGGGASDGDPKSSQKGSPDRVQRQARGLDWGCKGGRQ